MQHPAPPFAVAVHPSAEPWRYVATVTLMVICAPVFVVAALVAAVVVLPVAALLAGIAGATQVVVRNASQHTSGSR